jgi:putative hemolysin
MSSTLYEWLIIILIILGTSLFVLAEISLLTSRKAKLQKLSNEGSLAASKALQLKNQPEAFLSMAQVGITFMSILIGFYSGARITEEFSNIVALIPFLAPYSETVASFLVILTITYLTVLGEIIPKRLAMLYPEKFACLLSFFMLFFMKIFYPFVVLLSASLKFFFKIFKVKENQAEVTAEEIKMIITQAENEGTVDKTERDMIKRLIHLSDIKVGAIMTPRIKMICLDLHEPNAENLKKLTTHSFNYYPVIDGGLDKLVGLVATKQLLNTKITNSVINTKSKKNEVLFIPEVARLPKLLELFKEKRSKIAIVLDEYGEIEGIVSLNDILKTFVGDLATQEKGQAPSVTSRKDGSLIVNGNVPIEEIMEILQVTSLPGEDEEDYRTISSFILKQLNCVPKPGDSFKAVGHIFKVIKMDKFRIDKVSIKPEV